MLDGGEQRRNCSFLNDHSSTKSGPVDQRLKNLRHLADITTNILRSAQYHCTSQQIYCGLPSITAHHKKIYCGLPIITAHHNKYTAVCPVSLHITTNILRGAQYHCTSQQIYCGLPSTTTHRTLLSFFLLVQ